MTDERALSHERDAFGESRRSSSAGLCAPFVELLPVTGASISVFDEGGRQSTICATDSLAARLDELQFDLGEGPHWESLRTGAPVMIPYARWETYADWPMFGAAIRELELGALFAFPMVMGAVTVGVVDMYSSTPVAFTPVEVGTAVRLAGGVARRAVHQALRSAGDHPEDDAVPAPTMRREVHQATGMMLVQLKTSATEAFFRLKAYAFSSGRTVQEVAHDVVERRLDFSNLPD